MLPKANRLNKKQDFDRIFKEGEIIKSGFLLFKILKNHINESRFGFIVSKKVSSKAVLRNKIKRRLRDLAFNNLKEIKKPLDVIVIALPEIKKKDFSEIQEVFAKFFLKLKSKK